MSFADQLAVAPDLLDIALHRAGEKGVGKPLPRDGQRRAAHRETTRHGSVASRLLRTLDSGTPVEGANVRVTESCTGKTLATGATRRLTTDGSADIINGTTDWAYEEELDLRDALEVNVAMLEGLSQTHAIAHATPPDADVTVSVDPGVTVQKLLARKDVVRDTEVERIHRNL